MFLPRVRRPASTAIRHLPFLYSPLVDRFVTLTCFTEVNHPKHRVRPSAPSEGQEIHGNVRQHHGSSWTYHQGSSSPSGWEPLLLPTHRASNRRKSRANRNRSNSISRRNPLSSSISSAKGAGETRTATTSAGETPLSNSISRRPINLRHDRTNYGGAYHALKANGPTNGGVHHSGVPQHAGQVRSGFAQSRAGSWNNDHAPGSNAAAITATDP